MRNLMLVLCLSSLGFVAHAGAAKPYTLSVDNKPALTLQLPDKWTAKSHDGKTDIKTEYEVHIQLWPMFGAKTVAAATTLVPEFIKGEVTEFKTVKSEDINIAGAPAKHLIGTGSEADDGDPSNADVFLFSVGGKVFLVCAHGEGTGAAKVRAALMHVLSTAKP